MKKLFFTTVSFAVILLSSCANDSIESENSQPDAKDSPMVVESRKVTFTEAEQKLHEKVLRLSGDEFRNELNSMSEKELDVLATGFLLPECTAHLIENGYTLERIRAEFQGDDVKLIHKSLALYGERVNVNQ